MSPRANSKKSKNNRKGSNASLKKKISSPTNVSPTGSNEILFNSVQSNSKENVNNLSMATNKAVPFENPFDNKTSKPVENKVTQTVEALTKKNDTSVVDTNPVIYEITTTYKTEVIECTVDPETGDIIEVITEIYVTDAMNLKKPEEKAIESIHNSIESIVMNPVTVPSVQDTDLDLDDILNQLSMGTKICEEILTK